MIFYDYILYDFVLMILVLSQTFVSGLNGMAIECHMMMPDKQIPNGEKCILSIEMEHAHPNIIRNYIAM